ncbi:MAG: CoA transferase [Desulfobacteraceae bacterium]
MKLYNDMEMMIVVAARELENGKTVAVGTGAPCAAAMLAQKTHAPDLIIFFEAGGMSPKLVEMPISVGDSRTFHQACRAGSMGDVMDACARGAVDYTFLGGAQIDRFGKPEFHHDRNRSWETQSPFPRQRRSK